MVMRGKDCGTRNGMLDKSTLYFLKCIRTGMASGCDNERDNKRENKLTSYNV